MSITKQFNVEVSSATDQEWKVIRRFFYKEPFYSIELARANLLTVASLFEKFNIEYRLVFGALLGLYRDGELIPWDSDIDFFIFDEEFEKITSQQFMDELLDLGYVIRTDERTRKMRVFKDYIKVAINAFRKRSDLYTRSNYKIPRFMIEESSVLLVDNVEVRVPKEIVGFLGHVYGPQWSVPNDALNESEYTHETLYINPHSYFRRQTARYYLRWVSIIKKLFEKE